MKINLLKGSITYGAVTIFSRLAAILLIPILTRLLSPDEYGALNIIVTAVQLITLIVTLEIAQAVTFYFTDRDQQDREIYSATGLWFSLILYVFFVLLIFTFGSFISEFIGEMRISTDMLKSAAFLLGVNGTFFFLQNQLRLEFKSKQYAFLSIGYILLTSVGAVLGALFMEERSTGVILGQAIGASIVCIIGIILMWHRFRHGLDVVKLKQMLRLSFPLVPAGLFLLGGQQAPKFILSIYGNLEDVGIYVLASQVAGFAGLAMLGVQTAITPSVLANHHHEDTPKALGKLFEDFTIVALILCCFLSVYASELIFIFSTASYSSASGYVSFISFSIALYSLYIFYPGMIIRGKFGLQLYASGGSLLVAIVGGLVLIQLYGIMGAAISSFLSAITFMTIWYYLSQNLYPLPVRWNFVLISVLLAVAICLMAAFFIPSGFFWHLIISKAAVLGLFVFLVVKRDLFFRFLGKI